VASGSGGAGGARAGGAAAPAASGPSARGGGIALDFRRGKSAKKLLEVNWVHPVYRAIETPTTPQREGQTVAVMEERALPVEQAYEFVTDGDRRPLLVLRECDRCKGTDHALLSRTLDNEQTVLLTHWFRCVKLPTNVLNEKHPLYNMFKPAKEGDRIPHLFFADPDGQNRVALPGDQPQTQLWATMLSYLDRCYAESAKEAIKELRQVLSQYDMLDEQEQETKGRIDREIEKRGPESDKLPKLEADLAKFAKERQKLLAKEKELRDLALKGMPSTGSPNSPVKPADGKQADGSSAK